MVSNLNRVSGQFFETAGIAIVAGRAITPTDTLNSLKVVVVSQTIANRYFPKGDAIGHLLKVDMDSVPGPWQIVGIARDTKSGDPRETDSVRMTYIPLAQIEPYFVDHVSGQREENQQLYANTILLHTAGDPSKTIADLRAAVAGIDPNLPLIGVTTIQDQISNLTAHDELISTLTALFSLLALLLASIGLYGVMAYNVARRTNEIGIRLALGAQASKVVRMVLGESLVLLAIGSGSGLFLALLLTKVVKQQLFGLAPNDPLTFALAFLVVSGMTIMATWLPARRAAKVDPVAALRAE
jgi:predicted permease